VSGAHTEITDALAIPRFPHGREEINLLVTQVQYFAATVSRSGGFLK
jgi:hypothetical protein